MKAFNFVTTGLAMFSITSTFLLYSCGGETTDKNVTNQSDTTKQETSPSSSLKPANSKPAWGKDMTDPMTVVMEKLKSFNSPHLPDYLLRKQGSNQVRQMLPWP